MQRLELWRVMMVRRQIICDVWVRDRREDLADLSVMLCGLAAVVQTSGLNGAAFRRRTSTQGALMGGLSFFHRPQVRVFRLIRSRCFSHLSPCPRLSA